MNRFRRITALLFSTLILCCFPGAAALARSAVDVDRDAALTVVFRNTAADGAEERISNAEFRIYRIADIDRFSDYHWAGDFSSREEDFREMTQERWKELAETLWQEVRAAPKIRPLETKVTDGNGSFTLSGLRTGLYLVAGPETGNHRADGLKHEYYTPAAGIVSLPDLLPDDPSGTWQYSVTLYPKLTCRDPEPGPGPGPEPGKVTLLLQKQWSGGRKRVPVTIRLLRGDEVYGEYTVSEADGWQRRIELSAEEYAAHEWSISEIPVSGFRRSYSRSGMTFTVTNAYEGGGGGGGSSGGDGAPGKKTPPETQPVKEPPETEAVPEEQPSGVLPRTGLLWWPVPVLAGAGIVLVFAGTWLRSRDP